MWKWKVSSLLTEDEFIQVYGLLREKKIYIEEMRLLTRQEKEELKEKWEEWEEEKERTSSKGRLRR